MREAVGSRPKPLAVWAVCALALWLLFWARGAGAEGYLSGPEKGRSEHLQRLFPQADRFELVDRGFIRYEIAYQGEDRIGAAFYPEGRGYAGPMRIMVGIDAQGRVIEVILLSHQETLGLWTKQADEAFRSQFRGQSGPFILRRDDPSGNLDGVTSATITCRAIIGAVEEALRAFRREWGKGEVSPRALTN